MMIVDAQIHLWAKGKPSAHHRQTPYLKEEALAAMDAAGVDRAVIHPGCGTLIPTSWHPGRRPGSAAARTVHIAPKRRHSRAEVGAQAATERGKFSPSTGRLTG